ncbi:MAG: nucleoside kinase, partial [Clostridia bacterium]|nr:nucleoside kinase [Clostridia bacterium]
MAEIELKSINRAVEEDICGFIMNSEKRYSEVLNNLIDDLEKSGAKIILLAGPSSSGKTTTANIIKDSLADRGHKTVV